MKHATDRAPDLVVEGSPREPGQYVCPTCGAHFSPPQWPDAAAEVECHGVLVYLLPDRTTY